MTWHRILYESVVKAAFNTPRELLGELSGDEAAGVVRKLRVLTPPRRKLPVANSHTPAVLRGDFLACYDSLFLSSELFVQVALTVY